MGLGCSGFQAHPAAALYASADWPESHLDADRTATLYFAVFRQAVEEMVWASSAQWRW